MVSTTPFPADETDLAGALANANFVYQFGDATSIVSQNIHVGGISGRYVRLQLPGNINISNNMNVSEVQVLDYSQCDTDSDGTSDHFDSDSDDDGCFDTEEESVNDSDNDGVAGTGTPTVDGTGLVNSITYVAPPNNIWQNPLVGPCLPEDCDDGIDNNVNGLTDCDDPECISIPTISISVDTACVDEIFTISASVDSDIGTTYICWDFGANASPSIVCGIGPHNISYDACGIPTINLEIQSNGCTGTIDTTIVIFDDENPVWDTPPEDLIMECQPSANYTDSISLWLSNNGNGIVSDNCSVFRITNDYSGLTADCGNTESTLVTFTAIDSCGNLGIASANIQIIDTQGPEIDPIDDITVDCDAIPSPPTAVFLDSCDTTPDIQYTEVIVQHPNANWKSTRGCSILYTISDGIYDDKGTPGTSDDEMSFTLTVISQNASTQWNANIGGNNITGNYYQSIKINPFLSNGSSVSFIVSDDLNTSCNINIMVDSASFD